MQSQRWRSSRVSALGTGSERRLPEFGIRLWQHSLALWSAAIINLSFCFGFLTREMHCAVGVKWIHTEQLHWVPGTQITFVCVVCACVSEPL